jgi:hypothetical protein
VDKRQGQIDQMDIHVAPLLLGGGARLFDDDTDGRQTAFECVRVVHSPLASHYTYRRR